MDSSKESSAPPWERLNWGKYSIKDLADAADSPKRQRVILEYLDKLQPAAAQRYGTTAGKIKKKLKRKTKRKIKKKTKKGQIKRRIKRKSKRRN